ncbi:acetate/propionate family kinase [Paracoccus sp. Z118]|uniref:acetate/propionate family kinase n=1 Tax=Paracoccus sp. Z118 TaxID=2851017 RepID=UPI001C2CBD7C|nr:acetate/propionate family kinase [Paracoccus sp. Z118]MBV0892058.1 acetate/propionate family kinase [Paracoccus sp. Z118]
MTERDVILTMNAGSSTVKLGFFAIEGAQARRLASASIDFRVDPLEVRLKKDGARTAQALPAANPGDMISVLRPAFRWLGQHLPLDRIAAVGHRVVHGGEIFTGPALIDDETLSRMRDLSVLAPLHQPQSLSLIDAVRQLRPGFRQTASFDTAFHTTQDPLNRRFAIPRALHDQGIKRYGFHGLSYQHIAGALAGAGIAPGAKVVAAHLGSGASLCAISDGISRDGSMGFSTLDGVPMGTRCGALDPGVILHLTGRMGWEPGRVETLLYRESGLLGMSGIDADSRELLESDRPEAAEALGVFTRRIAGEVARLATSMGGLDAVVFTAGIGENQPRIRQMVCERLAWLGLELDPAANLANATRISTPDARVGAYVIPTDEEQVIADEALRVLSRAAIPG